VENCNEHAKNVFDGPEQVSAKVALPRCVAWGAGFACQLALLCGSEHGLDLNIGIKALLRDA
jgi:hypothetical protein